jgi:hypothetical protein
MIEGQTQRDNVSWAKIPVGQPWDESSESNTPAVVGGM